MLLRFDSRFKFYDLRIMNLKLPFTIYHSQNKGKSTGFTLIELLVAISIIGIVSVMSVNLLFTTVISRARQGSIQTTSEDVRNFINLLTQSVKEANTITLVGTTEIGTKQIKTSASGTDYICRTFKWSDWLGKKSIVYAEDNSVNCEPPTTGLSPIIDSKTDLNDPYYTEITSLNISQNDQMITLILSGNHKDPFGQHDFSYNTNISRRLD